MAGCFGAFGTGLCAPNEANEIDISVDTSTITPRHELSRDQVWTPIVFENNRPELGYDIVRAEFFSDLSIGVYLGEDIWCSRKPKMVRSVHDMSAWAKFKWGGFDRNTDWGLKALSASFDCESRDFTMRSGWIDSRSTDMTGILSLHPTNKWVVLVFKGTDSFSNILTDFEAWSSPHPCLPGNPNVYHGFLECYLCLRDAVLKACELFDGSDDSPTEMHITGHSLGGAIATLAAVDIAITLKSAAAKRGDKPPDVVVHTFGSPCVGREEFVALYDKEVPRTFRHVNHKDYITVAPCSIIGHKHVGTLVWMSAHVFIVHPKKDDKRVADDGEGGVAAFATDHCMDHYQNALRRVVVSERMPKEVFEIVRDSWIEMMEAPEPKDYRSLFVRHASNSVVVKKHAVSLFDQIIEEACFRGKLGFDDALVGLIRAELDSKPSFCLDTLLYLLYVMHYTDDEIQRGFCLRHATLRHFFNKYDTDFDHFMSTGELMQLLTDASLAHGLQAPSQEDAKAIFAEVDDNHDGEISFQEFVTAMSLGKEEIFDKSLKLQVARGQ